MSREILFKAKRIDNDKWVEGYLVKTCHNTYADGFRIIDKNGINYDELDDWEPSFIYYEVDENTICQYTGLTDKNGCKIWDNDIVRLNEDLYIVTWEEGDAMFALEDVGVVEHFSNVDSKWCEVVGNVFDNRDLLEN